ncbi:hypothetical protein K501DRAFT_242977 [Backusella circina FSU 941]|nr:hypothetical protein K501DRAFT_242977 [Backusella circina FSU 941]
MGNLPQVSSSIEDVTEQETQKTKDDVDGWDKDWSWGVDEDPVSSRVESITRSPSPNLPIKESYMISASAAGKSLVLAYKTKFVMVKVNSEGEYSALGQGSGCQQPGELITSVLCLSLFAPSTRSTQNYIMCGYNTGWIRVFSDAGVLLTEQQLEISSVLTMKIRTPPPVFKVSPHKFVNEDEDITILFENNKVVSIDGQSLWMVLRVCDGQRESGIDASRMHTAFNYKKWDLQHQGQVRDVVSLGPSPVHTESTETTATTTISTEVFPCQVATSRYIGVGAQPMLTFYSTSESTRPLMSAASMASYVVSRVTTPVFSFAKSWWGGNSSSSNNNSNNNSGSNSPRPYVPDLPQPPSHIEPATTIPAILSASDSYRTINQISLCPPSTSAQQFRLAATSDALGRVILWDVKEGEMIRMWKGVRDAVCGWIEVFERDIYPVESNRILQFLVIYSSKRGILKVFQMRHGKQIGVYHVGPGWQLVTCGHEPLGSSMVSMERRRGPNEEYGGLSQCLIVGPDGDVRRININLQKEHS